MQNKLPLLGFFIISLLLYRRLFKERLPKEILPTDDILIIALNILLCVGMFFLLCINIYFFFNFLYTREIRNPNNNSSFNKIKILLQHKANPLFVLSQSLLAFDMFIKNHIKYDTIDKIIMYITNHFNLHKKFFIYLFILIIILVQSIVSISFFVDIFIYKKFYYFYKTLWLLIFPLIINYLFYSIKTFLDTNFNSLEDVLILKIIKTSDYLHNNDEKAFVEIKIHDWRNISKNAPSNTIICYNALSPEYLRTRPFLDKEKTLHYCVNSMNDFITIDSFLDQYALKKNQFILPFNIFKYILYTIGWGYIAYLIC